MTGTDDTQSREVQLHPLTCQCPRPIDVSRQTIYSQFNLSSRLLYPRMLSNLIFYLWIAKVIILSVSTKLFYIYFLESMSLMRPEHSFYHDAFRQRFQNLHIIHPQQRKQITITSKDTFRHLWFRQNRPRQSRKKGLDNKKNPQKVCSLRIYSYLCSVILQMIGAGRQPCTATRSFFSGLIFLHLPDSLIVFEVEVDRYIVLSLCFVEFVVQ